MKSPIIAGCALLLLAALVFIAPAAPFRFAHAQKGPPSAESMPEYKPPVRGAPARRVGGSSRGLEGDTPSLTVLAPDHVGLTVSEQPSLYWYLSRPTSVRVEITLIDDKGTTPIIEFSVKDAGAGVHRLNLADHNVRLKSGVEYQWSVSLVPDPAERSNDVVSGSAVKRIDVPAGLAEQLKTAGRNHLPAIYAGAGIWYDAISALSESIAAQPGDAKLHAQRAALLEQVNLKDVAAFDRRGAGQ